MTGQRPGKLTAIAVVAIILGCTGVLGAAWGLLGTAMQAPLTKAQEGLLERAGDTEMARAQLHMQHQLFEAMHAWMPYTLTAHVLNLLASALLLAAGILLLRWAPAAPRLFKAAVVGNVLADGAGAAIGTLMQIQTMSVMAHAMPFAAGGQNDAQFQRVIEAMMKATGWVGACFAGVWLLLKLGYYVWAIYTLKQPEMQRLFEPYPTTPGVP